MAFNPDPKVAAARNFGNKFNKDMVIILSLKGDKLEYASYGTTKNLCSKAKKLADVAFGAILNSF